MRVLHVTDTFLPKLGGAELAIDRLVRAMQGHGVHPVVLTQVADVTTPPTTRGIDPAGPLPYPVRRYARPASSLWAGWRIANSIHRLNSEFGPFDAIIGHHAFPSGHAVVSCAKTSGARVIHVRGGDVYHGARWRKKPIIWRRLTRALARADAVIVSSRDMLGLVNEIVSAGGYSARTHLLPNGVDPDEFRADASSSRFASDPRLRGPFILALGRLISRKGFHLLIDAFAKASVPHDWHLVIAGEGKELDSLRQQAADSAMSPRILFTGPVSGVDRNYLLQHCAFMAAPSIEESFGNVALEVMICGRPLLATRTGGFADLVKDSHNGLLIPPGDLTALTSALDRLTREPLTQMGQAAAIVAEEYTWTNIASKYINILRQPGQILR